MTKIFANLYDASAKIGELATVDQAPTLQPHEVEDVVLACRIVDSCGREVSDANYQLTVAVALAASRLWSLKAAKAAGQFDFRTDNQSFDRSQIQEHCMAMAKHYQNQCVGAWPMPATKTKSRFVIGQGVERLMFTTSELAAMRATVATTFTATATKLIKSKTSDGRGGNSVVWAEDISFPVRLSTSPPSSRQQIEFGQVVSESTYSLVYGFEIRLTAKDRVRVLENDYEILAVHEASSIALHSRASARRIQ